MPPKKSGPKPKTPPLAPDAVLALITEAVREAGPSMTASRARAASPAIAGIIAALDAAQAQADATSSHVRAIRAAVIHAQVALGMKLTDVAKMHGLSRQRIGQFLDEFPEAIRRKPRR